MIAPVALPARPSRSAQSVFGMSRLSLGVGLIAGAVACLAVQTAAAQIQALLRDAAWHTAARHSAPARPVFGEELGQMRLTKVLSGVSGEVVSPAALRMEIASNGDARASTALSNVSPAAWDRLSAGGCITLTTKSGQTLSFRITGGQPAGEQQLSDTLPRIDLAVTTCTGTAEPIAKAIIEPVPHSPVKSAAGQRAL